MSYCRFGEDGSDVYVFDSAYVVTSNVVSAGCQWRGCQSG